MMTKVTLVTGTAITIKGMISFFMLLGTTQEAVYHIITK